MQVSAVVHIVDDDESFRISTERLLRASGYAVETYESAEQLLQHCPMMPVRAAFFSTSGFPA